MKTVACPRCQKPVPWVPASRFRPFCSERCKQLDVGAWANEEYRIAHAEPPEHDAFSEACADPGGDGRR